ncbi:MAG: hypothetical protein ACPGR8_10295 [Limisphaerales bacterium]
MSADMPFYRHPDPVGRDCFTALDVAALQVPFIVEGLQARPVMAKVGFVAVAMILFVTLPTSIVIGATAGLAMAGALAAAGWLLQLGLHMVGEPATPASTRPATWFVTVLSLVHYITLLNLYHHALSRDWFIKVARLVIYVLHVISLTTLVFIFIVMESLHEAWGCYGGKGLKELDRGPCGESTALPWVNKFPQAVCRDFLDAEPDANGNICTSKQTGLAYFDRHATFALYLQAAALAIYTMACWHAFALYWKATLNRPAAKQTLTQSWF